MVSLHWHTEPTLLVLALGGAWLWLVLAGPFRAVLAPGEPFPVGRAVTFGAGVVVGYLAVGSPLDALGEQFLFSAHMFQHLLLMLVAPPLLVAGLPPWMADAPLRWKPVRAVAAAVAHPVVAGVATTILMTGWHVPAAYELALRSKPVHILEHLCMFVPSLAVWWGFASTSRLLPRRGHGVRMLTAFLLIVGQMPLFGFLVLGDRVLYPTYEFAPRVDFFPISPSDDQILGGLMMMVANIAAWLTAFGEAFFAWARDESRPGRP